MGRGNTQRQDARCRRLYGAGSADRGLAPWWAYHAPHMGTHVSTRLRDATPGDVRRTACVPDTMPNGAYGHSCAVSSDATASPTACPLPHGRSMAIELDPITMVEANDARKAPKGYWRELEGHTEPRQAERLVELGSGHRYYIGALWTAFQLLGRLQ